MIRFLDILKLALDKIFKINFKILLLYLKINIGYPKMELWMSEN